MNRLFSLLCLGALGCSAAVDKDFIFVALVAPGGPSPVVDEVQLLVEGNDDPISFLIAPAQAVPVAGDGALFSMVLDFPKEERGAQVGLEVTGLSGGAPVFFGGARATVGRELEVPVQIAVSFCGNGAEEEQGEECDDGNRIDNDGCSAACLDEFCGDCVQQTNEQCDDGNTTEEDGCDQFCIVEECGDGILQVGLGEECDDGNGIEGDACDSNCTFPGCGNGK